MFDIQYTQWFHIDWLPIEWLTAISTLLYIDPGTGQVFLYALAAVAASALFKIRQFKDWVVAKFTRRSSESEQDE